MIIKLFEKYFSRYIRIKFVRKVVSENQIGVLFRAGEAELILPKESSELDIHKNQKPFRGVFAAINF